MSSSNSSSNWEGGNINNNNNSSRPSVFDERDLEALPDPIQSVIAWMFYLTAFFSLIFNISAIVLLVSQFGRRRSSTAATTKASSRAPPLSYSPSLKVPLSVNSNSHNSHNNNNNTLVTTANSSNLSTTTTFQHQTTLGQHYHHPHHHHPHHHSFYQHQQSQHHHPGGAKGTTRSCAGHKIRSGSSQLRIYLLNLFLNDILIALFTTPFSYTDFMYGSWKYPAFLCPVTSFITTCAVAVSIYTLIAIGLERYVSASFSVCLSRSISYS